MKDLKHLQTFESYSAVNEKKKETKEKEDKKEDKKDDKKEKSTISKEDLKLLSPKQQKAKVPDGMKKHWVKAAKKKASKTAKEDK